MESFHWFKLRKLSSYPVIFRNEFCGYAVEQFSDDEYGCDSENHPASSSVVNVDEWKWKLSMLLPNDKDQEIVSRDKRDRRDFEQISGLAIHMGLYWYARLAGSAKDYSYHMALVRAYEGWKDAEREGSAYEYCWRNFLSVQTLQAIHSLRKQFTFILKDAQLLDADGSINNRLSHNQSLVRSVICSGPFPGSASVVHRETSMSFETMDDCQVFLYAQTIPCPWLDFGEKVKVNTVFIRDSTGVSDSILILFGGGIDCGGMVGNLKMLGGYIDFFMDPSLAECYVKLKEELEKLLQKKACCVCCLRRFVFEPRLNRSRRIC